MDFCFQDYTKSIAMIINRTFDLREREQITKFRSVYTPKYAYITWKSMKVLPQLAVQTAIK